MSDDNAVKKNLVVVKCPDCGLKLSFKPVPNYKIKPITCPKCHHSDTVEHFIIVQDPAQVHEPESYVVDEDDEGTRPVNAVSASISCVETGEEFVLKQGPNTIGRKASTPKADILFTDNDLYMSRLHATITFLIAYGAPQFQLRDENSANGTYVKGTRIPEKSIVKLLPGDEFKMGKLTFVCKTNMPVSGSKKHNAYDSEETTF